LPRAIHWRGEVPAGRDGVPRVEGRRGIQGNHAPDWRLVRRLRQREDRVEGQHGPVSGGRGEWERELLGTAAVLTGAEKRHAHVDRLEWELQPRLRPRQYQRS